MKTSLGIWAFGAMATRFNPGGYKPDLAGISTADKVRTAVEGLGEDAGRFLGVGQLVVGNGGQVGVEDAAAIADQSHHGTRLSGGGRSRPSAVARRSTRLVS